MNRILPLFALMIAFTGCATTPQSDPLPISAGKHFTLAEELRWSGYTESGEIAITIEPGEYVCEWEDERGLYLRGPTGGFNLRRAGIPTRQSGGVYLPHNRSRGIAVYAAPEGYTAFATTFGAAGVPPEGAKPEIWPMWSPGRFGGKFKETADEPVATSAR